MVKGYRLLSSNTQEVMFARFADNSLASTALRDHTEEFNPSGTKWHTAHRLPIGVTFLGEFDDPFVTQSDEP